MTKVLSFTQDGLAWKADANGFRYCYFKVGDEAVELGADPSSTGFCAEIEWDGIDETNCDVNTFEGFGQCEEWCQSHAASVSRTLDAATDLIIRAKSMADEWCIEAPDDENPQKLKADIDDFLGK